MGRRLSLHEMNSIRHDDDVRNSQIKRGEWKHKSNNTYHVVCGCGAFGCAFVTSLEQTVVPFDQRPRHEQYATDVEAWRSRYEEWHARMALELAS